MTRQAVTFRLPPDLVQWLRESTADREQTALVEHLLRAKRDGRLVVSDEPAPYAPAVLRALRERRLAVAAVPAPDRPNTGASADYPVLVCHHPT